MTDDSLLPYEEDLDDEVRCRGYMRFPFDEVDEEECAICGQVFTPELGASGMPKLCPECWDNE